MAVFSDGGVSSPDIYISVSYICVIIACTVLNSLVFVHNFQKKSSVARNLYLFLSAADLLTSWVLLGASSVDFLKEKEEECRNSDEVTCNKDYFKRVVDATLGIKLYSVISYTMSLSPTHITGFLAGTRFLQITDQIPSPSITAKIRDLITSHHDYLGSSGCWLRHV